MSITVHHGDCLDVLRDMGEASIDAVVCDPPYGLEFMGKDWDAPWKKGLGENRANTSDHGWGDGHRRTFPTFTGDTNPSCLNCGGTKQGRERPGRKVCRCDDARFPNTTLPRMRAFQDWCEAWAREVYRVMKPGAHLVAFGGTRTYHRMVCAIEDAGFEIRDQLAWLYGSGFPKSHDIGKAIDRAAGAEREVVGRRPISYADSDCWGTPNANVAGASGYGRGWDGNTEAGTRVLTAPATDAARQWQGWGTALKPAHEPIVLARKPLACPTVAAQVLATGTGALNVDGCRVGMGDADRERLEEWHGKYAGRDYAHNEVLGRFAEKQIRPPHAAGRWPANIVHDGSPEVLAAFAAFGERRTSGNKAPTRQGIGYGSTSMRHAPTIDHGDTGTAARFFYSSKASKAERAGSKHPTVKPLALMRWLCRLVTPPGGLVLDMFAGTGVTGEAALLEGFSAVLVEREAEHVADIRRRLGRARGDDAPLFAESAA